MRATTTTSPAVTRRRTGSPLRVGAAVFAAMVAFTAYAGVLGLLGGGLSFNAEIERRLPFDSYVLAGLALLAFVAVPMTLAAVALWRRTTYSVDVLEGSGAMLVLWIAVQLAFIKTYSWFHPAYLIVAVVAISLAMSLRIEERRDGGR